MYVLTSTRLRPHSSLLALLLLILPLSVLAHGEVAQMASIRMRTIHWFDTQISPQKVKVNDIVTVRGKFKVSSYWPDYLAKPEGWVFLGMGAPGPVFVREASYINGAPHIRSTALQRGRYYEYEVKLKARVPGHWHVHPLLNVWEAGAVVGPGQFVDIEASPTPFVNEATLLNGEKVNLENYGIKGMWAIHIFWLIVGVAWITYWFWNRPVLMRRFVTVQDYGEAEAERRLISIKDAVVGIFAGLFVVAATGGWYFWSQHRYPITMPLQTGKIPVPTLPEPAEAKVVTAQAVQASFNIPLRDMRLQVNVTNHGDRPIRVGEFVTGYTRFVNPDVLQVKRRDYYDMVAPESVNVPAQTVIQPGQTSKVTISIQDSLWEQERLTSVAEEPDVAFSGLLFFYDDQGHRYYHEVGGQLKPVFSATGNGFSAQADDHPSSQAGTRA